MSVQGEIGELRVEDVSDEIDNSEINNTAAPFRFNYLTFQDSNDQANYEFFQRALTKAPSHDT